MDTPSPRLTRRRLLAGVAAAGVASTGAGATTMAMFSETHASSGNEVQAGSLDLTFGSPSSLDLTKDLTPGSSVSSSVELVNASSVTGSLDVDVTYTDSGGNNSADAVATELEVTTLSYGGTSRLGDIRDHNGNGIVDLMDLSDNEIRATGETTPNDLTNLADPGAGTTFAIELTLQKGTNSLDGNSIDVQATFHLNQTDGQ